MKNIILTNSGLKNVSYMTDDILEFLALYKKICDQPIC